MSDRIALPIDEVDDGPSADEDCELRKEPPEEEPAAPEGPASGEAPWWPRLPSVAANIGYIQEDPDDITETVAEQEEAREDLGDIRDEAAEVAITRLAGACDQRDFVSEPGVGDLFKMHTSSLQLHIQ